VAPTEPRWLTDDEQRAWRAYMTATNLLDVVLGHELEHDAGLSHGEYQILVMLSEVQGRRLRMSELAERTQSSRSRLSHTVGRLEAAGWVVREQCPTDRRGTEAVLTPAGFRKLERAAPGHVEAVRHHLFDLLTPAQVGQLEAISTRIAEHLTEHPATR
jgi:DNA-binding MarR family transcriptional regulator